MSTFTRKLTAIARRYAFSTRGSMTITNVIMSIPLVAIGGTAVDYARVSRAHDHIQQVIDGAALAAAAVQGKNGQSDKDKMTTRSAVAQAFLTKGLAQVDDIDLIGTPVVTVGPNTVDISVKTHVKSTFINAMNAIQDMTSQKNAPGQHRNFDTTFVTSTKTGYQNERYLCLLSMDGSMKDAIYFQGNSEFMATCAVQANSNNAVAIQTWGNAYAYAYNFCAVGGWSGSGFSPNPVGGCKYNPDPYKDMVLPTAASTCTAAYTNVTVKNATQNLQPGTYCGGLKISTHGVANLAPGLYILKNGTLNIDSQSTLNAPKGVVFYLTGASAAIDIASGATVTIVGPNNDTAIASTAAYKGFAIMQDRTTAVGITNQISSKGFVNITGGIYTPSQSLNVVANGDMNSDSPYFPMTVKSLNMNGTATLFVNLNYQVADLDEPVALQVPADVFVSQ